MQKNRPATLETGRHLLFQLGDWFSSSRYLSEDSFTARLRSFQITGFVIFFISSFFNFLTRLDYSYIITSSCCFFLIVIRYLIDKQKPKTSYFLMLVSFNLALFLLVYVEGLRSGVFLFFFPCLISFAFLADFTQRRQTRITYVVCIGTLVASLLIGTSGGHYQEMTEQDFTQNFYFNVVVSFLVICWMSFSLSRENHRRHTSLKSKEVFLDTIFNSSLHAEVIIDLSTGLITNYNQHAITLFGLKPGETLREKPLRHLFYELVQEQDDLLYQQICNPHSNWTGELTCMRMDGSDFPGSISVVAFPYNEKTYEKLTIRDVSRKNQIMRELEDAKKRAEASAAVKSQFLSHMSHELRTPLNGIIGATNLLLQDKFLPSQTEQLNILKFSSEHMLSLVNDVLDLSKLEADKIKLEKIAVVIPKFINTVVSPFAQQFKDKGLEFEAIIDPEIKQPVLTDPTRINQVLTNLLSNALKFTRSGGVTLKVSALSIKSDQQTLEFSVADTGIGISVENQKSIFKQFSQADLRTTRKYGGTGLGLTISKKLVHLMGGDLKLESQYNVGSRFYFAIQLPVHKGRERTYLQADGQSINGNQQLSGLRVLIAEDNPVNMMIVARFMDKWGVKYEKAKNGQEAVERFEKDRFDILLMDLEMPEMDGYGALSAIRGKDRDIPAIAFTAAVFENMREKLLSCGFNDYIQKPFRPEDLHAKLLDFFVRYRKTA